MNSPVSIKRHSGDVVVGSKLLNHEFFLLVRDQNYQEAYVLGQQILRDDPDNSAVANFCDFIKNNSEQLTKMFGQQREYTDGSEDEEQEYSEQEQDQDQEDSQEQSEKQQNEQKASVITAASNSGGASTINAKKQSINKIDTVKKAVKSPPANKQNAHKWQHTCKNLSCPNKKPHKHHK